ncbi:AtpZ/AtpI family protein [Aureimonas sp. AU40]|uniref:AtpZ/AtpI family protein n=1 Tax=Aureimonas sp. AU40 TaxID=1637747 RepID=UPI000784CBBA|nr:AtpZ/AtpI family protein [Aureimonas sp. AU40]
MTMSEPEPRSEADLEADRRKLKERIDRLKAATAEPVVPEGGQGSMQGMAQGLKIASEFIAGIMVGGAIGYGIDRLFGVSPFGLIVFLMLGFAAGVLNVVRSASGEKDPTERR